jgi:hypothetical protein
MQKQTIFKETDILLVPFLILAWGVLIVIFIANYDIIKMNYTKQILSLISISLAVIPTVITIRKCSFRRLKLRPIHLFPAVSVLLGIITVVF